MKAPRGRNAGENIKNVCPAENISDAINRIGAEIYVIEALGRRKEGHEIGYDAKLGVFSVSDPCLLTAQEAIIRVPSRIPEPDGPICARSYLSR